MKLSFVIILLLITRAVHPQTIISGKVANINRDVLASVSIAITESYKGASIAFGISNKAGEFKVAFSSLNDSIWVQFTAIGFTPLGVHLSNKSQQLALVTLQNATENLPTVLVKNKPVTQRGDTLNYDVVTFTGKQDRMIGDVIKNLPGIVISDNGQITFEGNPISHYYIDGLDMLGSQYNIANRNIPADLVARVQVLQRHQSIKMLEGIKKGELPALNIKLKAKARNRFIGKGQIGVGAAPLLWDNEITALNFRNGFQLLAAFKNNNTGNILGNEVNESITITQIGDDLMLDAKPEVIPPLNFNIPAIAPRRYMFNNSNLLHTNTLKLLKNKAQFTSNLSYLNDFSTYNSKTENTFIFPDNAPIKFSEVVNGSINTNIVRGKFGYVLNNRRAFIKEQLKMKLQFLNFNSGIINAGVTAQKLNAPLYELNNDYAQLIPLRKHFISFKSIITLSRQLQYLGLTPGYFEGILNNGNNFQALQQNVIVNTVSSKNNVTFLKKYRSLTSEIKLGAAYELRKLTSNVDITENDLQKRLSGDFINALVFQQFSFFAEARTTITKPNYEWTFKVPISWNAVQARDFGFKKDDSRNNFFFNPFINFNKHLSEHYSLDVSYSRYGSAGNFLQQSNGYIVTDYRNIRRNNSPLAITISQNISAAINFKNPVAAFFYGFSVSISQTNNEIIYQQQFDGFSVTSAALPLSNTSKDLNLSANASKYFITQQISLRLTSNLSFSKIPFLQNGELVNSNGINPNAKLEIRYSKIKKLEIIAQSQYATYRNKQANRNSKHESLSTANFNQNLQLNYTITTKTDIFCNNEYYAVSNNNKPIANYFFGNVGLRTSIKKIDFSLEWTNITNNRSYQSITNFQNLQSIVTYQIRPANILGKVFFNF